MHFTSAIHNTAFQIVLGFVELCSGGTETNFQKRSYADLCTVSFEFGTLLWSYASGSVFTNILILTVRIFLENRHFLINKAENLAINRHEPQSHQ